MRWRDTSKAFSGCDAKRASSFSHSGKGRGSGNHRLLAVTMPIELSVLDHGQSANLLCLEQGYCMFKRCRR